MLKLYIFFFSQKSAILIALTFSYFPKTSSLSFSLFLLEESNTPINFSKFTCSEIKRVGKNKDFLSIVSDVRRVDKSRPINERPAPTFVIAQNSDICILYYNFEQRIAKIPYFSGACFLCRRVRCLDLWVRVRDAKHLLSRIYFPPDSLIFYRAVAAAH